MVSIKEYNLKGTDVDKSRRNFPGYTEKQYFTLQDIQSGDTAGTTETDSKTDPKGSGGYSKINSRS